MPYSNNIKEYEDFLYFILTYRHQDWPYFDSEGVNELSEEINVPVSSHAAQSNYLVMLEVISLNLDEYFKLFNLREGAAKDAQERIDILKLAEKRFYDFCNWDLIEYKNTALHHIGSTAYRTKRMRESLEKFIETLEFEPIS